MFIFFLLFLTQFIFDKSSYEQRIPCIVILTRQRDSHPEWYTLDYSYTKLVGRTPLSNCVSAVKHNNTILGNMKIL